MYNIAVEMLYQEQTVTTVWPSVYKHQAITGTNVDWRTVFRGIYLSASPREVAMDLFSNIISLQITHLNLLPHVPPGDK